MGWEAIDHTPPPGPLVGAPQGSPDLRRGVTLGRVTQVWRTDMTDMRRCHGLVSVVAIREWCARDVVAWAVAVTLDRDCGISALERARGHAQPEMCTAAPGAPFTRLALTARLKARGMHRRMEGRGRALDHRVVERVWRTVKAAEGARHDDRRGPEAIRHLRRSCPFEKGERLHHARPEHTPAAVSRQLAKAREGRVPPSTRPFVVLNLGYSSEIRDV
jgi:putative transposase